VLKGGVKDQKLGKESKLQGDEDHEEPGKVENDISDDQDEPYSNTAVLGVVGLAKFGQKGRPVKGTYEEMTLGKDSTRRAPQTLRQEARAKIRFGKR